MNLPPLPNAFSYVPSPCVGVCRMNEASGWCEGCLRTRDEIAAWGKLADRDKFGLWQSLMQRRRELSDPALGRSSDQTPDPAALALPDA